MMVVIDTVFIPAMTGTERFDLRVSKDKSHIGRREFIQDLRYVLKTKYNATDEFGHFYFEFHPYLNLKSGTCKIAEEHGAIKNDNRFGMIGGSVTRHDFQFFRNGMHFQQPHMLEGGQKVEQFHLVSYLSRMGYHEYLSYTLAKKLSPIVVNDEFHAKSAGGIMTSLMIACMNANWECVQLLLQYGADYRVTKQFGTDHKAKTCLHFAIDMFSHDFERIEKLSDCVRRYQSKNRIKIVKKLIEIGGERNMLLRECDYNTSQENEAKSMENENQKRVKMVNPVLHCVEYGSVSMMHLLMSFKTTIECLDASIVDGYGRNVLHIAVDRTKAEPTEAEKLGARDEDVEDNMLEYLLGCTSNNVVDKKLRECLIGTDESGQTPLLRAVSGKKSKAVMWLRKWSNAGGDEERNT